MMTQTTFMWPRRFHRSHSVGKRFPKIQKGVASLVSSYLEIEFHWPYPHPGSQALYPMVEGENGQRRWFLPVLPKRVLQGIGPGRVGRSGTVDVWVISNWWIHHFLDQLVRAKWELACPVPASSLVKQSYQYHWQAPGHADYYIAWGVFRVVTRFWSAQPGNRANPMHDMHGTSDHSMSKKAS